MRIPEKTILAIGGVILTLSTLKSLGYVIDGHALDRMHRMVGRMGSPESFRIGYVTGLAITLALKVFAAIGTWLLLVLRWRRPKADA